MQSPHDRHNSNSTISTNTSNGTRQIERNELPEKLTAEDWTATDDDEAERPSGFDSERDEDVRNALRERVLRGENSGKNEESILVALPEDKEYDNGLAETEMKESPPLLRGFQTNPDEQQPRICIALSILFPLPRKLVPKIQPKLQLRKRIRSVENDDELGLRYYDTPTLHRVNPANTVQTDFLFNRLIFCRGSWSILLLWVLSAVQRP